MTFNISGFALGLLIAVLVYYLLNIAIETFVSDEPARKTFKFILLVGCLVIAFVSSFLLKLSV